MQGAAGSSAVKPKLQRYFFKVISDPDSRIVAAHQDLLPGNHRHCLHVPHLVHICVAISAAAAVLMAEVV
jgi:hypothetical protein